MTILTSSPIFKKGSDLRTPYNTEFTFHFVPTEAQLINAESNAYSEGAEAFHEAKCCSFSDEEAREQANEALDDWFKFYLALAVAAGVENSVRYECPF